MCEISCDLVDFVVQICGVYYQYLDGFMLFFGMMFLLIQDCDVFGVGFMYYLGDCVMILMFVFGVFVNIVWFCMEIVLWIFGVCVLYVNLVVCGLFVE